MGDSHFVRSIEKGWHEVLKQIGVAGYQCEDIIIYLAGIVSKLGKKTAIVDRSEQEMLCEMLGIEALGEKTVREREYCGIWISNQTVCAEEFDVVFYLFGYRLNHPKIHACEEILMITDGVPAHSSLLRMLNPGEGQRYLVIRNLTALKHTSDYLAELADSKNAYCELPYDEKDIRQRCSLSSYGGFELKRLSTGMRRTLLGIACFFMREYPKSVICNVMKKM